MDGPVYIRCNRRKSSKKYERTATYESQCLDMGYEGVISHDPDGLYKEGRSDSTDAMLENQAIHRRRSSRN